MRRHNFIGHFGEEAPLYSLFERGEVILLGKFGRRLVDFFYLCPKLCWRLAGVSFYGPCSTWRAGHLDQVILLVWPYSSSRISYYIPLISCLISCTHQYPLHMMSQAAVRPTRHQNTIYKWDRQSKVVSMYASAYFGTI